MYQDLMLPGLQPIYAVAERFHVPVTILRTYAHPRPLLPLLVSAGINCLWAVEAPPDEMDYLDIRREFGKDLRLIGGIDTDILREPSPEQRPAAIRAALDRVAALVEEGGYIPLLDGRVRDDVRYEDYLFYRQELRKITDHPYG
jgi:uroporphyrinogen decarboxylase